MFSKFDAITYNANLSFVNGLLRIVSIDVLLLFETITSCFTCAYFWEIIHVTGFEITLLSCIIIDT